MSTNRRVVIDNATLSGVERITGMSQTLNLNNVDNDILCLEKLVTAILFSDELIGVDDYKDEFRSSRLKNFDFIGFTKIDQPTYAALAEDAAKFARSMAFSFEGSKPAGDVVSFFEALRIDPQLRWDVWVSSEYLTLSYLVKDTKYASYETSIDSVFRNEDADRALVAVETDHRPAFSVADRPDIADVKDLVGALSSNNSQYAGTDGKSALDRILFGYGWAAERSHFYNAVAHTLEADAYLAPLRDAFCESCCRIDYPSQVIGLLETLKAKSQETLSSILEPSGQARFAIRLPFFTAYLISRTSNPNQCIDLALSMRNMSEFRECRTIFQNLNHLSAADKIQEVNGILKYLEQSCASLMKKYAVSTDNGLQFSLSLGLTGITLGASLKLNQLFRSYKNKPFARIFRNIAQDMLNVERLGGLHDKICSSIRKHPKATYPKISATPKYMEHKQSGHSRPAEL
ncbi:hypothetical protein EB230_20990 [Mesorhizobium sp. NZP2234]|uniref:hypothetical protein n=1 Tax=Mesorhizobium sp. NZP2234 TaxID=2483402 RepID=UPI0015548E33|nr:hypothetical protein [Mesorhizobium sp. NZP2234]QKC90600.1 hypothetical protein EB230_20990 [Mesorhizobium sp. NZP2234]